MSREAELLEEVKALRSMLAGLSEASARINLGQDLDTVLQDVLDSARTLTGARYGIIATVDSESGLDAVFSSGLSEEEHRKLLELPDVLRMFELLKDIPAVLRAENNREFLSALGLNRPPTTQSGIAAPIRHHGETVGTLYLGHEGPDRQFGDEDEELLVVLAALAAALLVNVRRYRAEQRARNDLETLIDMSPIGVMVLDGPTGAPVIVNREALRIVSPLVDADQGPEELLRTVTVRRTDGSALSLAEHPVAELLQLREVIRAREYDFEVDDGRSVKVQINATPILAEDGALEHGIFTLQDMAPIEELERLRAEFLAMVSHELRAPLSSVKGSVTNLLNTAIRLDPAEVGQFLRIIDTQTDRMRQLISDLLDVARIESGSLSTQSESSPLASLIEEARAAFSSAGARQALVIEIPPQLPPVMVDRQRLVQVLVNLLNNAARNSPADSTIRIGASSDDVYVSVLISDEGRGIPAERLPQLFRKFSRVEAEDQGGDTGLGLAICKGIVEAHGGRIWAESDGLNQGARFTFTIPIADESRLPERRSSPDSPTLFTDQQEADLPSILVVDDDPEALRYIRDALSQARFQPLLTANPEHVLQLAIEHEPALVLLDLVLPGRDGLELMQDLHQIRKLPVIFLSAYGQEDTIARAFELGADDYIVKPFSPTELAARIRAVLRRREVRQPSEPYVHSGLVVDYAKRRVTLDGRLVELTSIEYRLLSELSSHAGQVVTFDDIMTRVWGTEETEDRRALRTAVKSLRRKLGDNARSPRFIFTEHRVGYRMSDPQANL